MTDRCTIVDNTTYLFSDIMADAHGLAARGCPAIHQGLSRLDQHICRPVDCLIVGYFLIGTVSLAHPGALDPAGEPLVVELFGADGAGVLDTKDCLVVIGYGDDEVITQGTAERADNISYFFWHSSSLPYQAAGVLYYLDCTHDSFIHSDFYLNRESFETRFSG